jgi:hypothetical protein
MWQNSYVFRHKKTFELNQSVTTFSQHLLLKMFTEIDISKNSFVGAYHSHLIVYLFHAMEQHILDTNAGKKLS